MKTLGVPANFQRRRPRSNAYHDLNYSVAEAFLDAVTGGLAPKTDRIYIPILWSNNYHNQGEFKAVPEIQQFLDEAIDARRSYFTVTRCDEGIYETLPSNVLVFGAGDWADVLIPLGSELTPARADTLKYLASFAGCKRSGGPRPYTGKPSFSNYDIEGVGTRLRTKMFEAFAGRKDCFLVDQNGSGVGAWETFANTIRQSKFALAPRGYAPTSFRLYEAMALGAVPVYISDKMLQPYGDELDWDEFCVECSESDIQDLPQRLADISEQWRLHAISVLANLYPKYFSLTGICNRIARYLEEHND